ARTRYGAGGTLRGGCGVRGGGHGVGAGQPVWPSSNVAGQRGDVEAQEERDSEASLREGAASASAWWMRSSTASVVLSPSPASGSRQKRTSRWWPSASTLVSRTTGAGSSSTVDTSRTAARAA